MVFLQCYGIFMEQEKWFMFPGEEIMEEATAPAAKCGKERKQMEPTMSRIKLAEARVDQLFGGERAAVPQTIAWLNTASTSPGMHQEGSNIHVRVELEGKVKLTQLLKEVQNRQETRQ